MSYKHLRFCDQCGHAIQSDRGIAFAGWREAVAFYRGSDRLQDMKVADRFDFCSLKCLVAFTFGDEE